MSEYQEQFNFWHSDYAPEPEHTCPAINAAQKDLSRAEDYVKSIFKKCDNCNDDASSALYEIGDVSNALENLRKENENLRDYGNFWRKKCLEVCVEFDAYIQEQKIAQG